MSDIPSDLRYAESHEWVSQEEEGVVKVGISDHAQEQLGDLVFVELPEEGDTVSRGDACSVVESVKAASDIYSPVSGEVVAGHQSDKEAYNGRSQTGSMVVRKHDFGAPARYHLRRTLSATGPWPGSR